MSYFTRRHRDIGGAELQSIERNRPPIERSSCSNHVSPARASQFSAEFVLQPNPELRPRLQFGIVGEGFTGHEGPRVRYAQGEAGDPMYVPTGTAHQPQINAAVAEVVRELRPHVQRIRYEIAPDWSGQWAVFFRVLLSDEASNERNLREIAPQVVWRMSEKLDLPSLGLFPYFDFRSQSEQATLNEPAWA